MNFICDSKPYVVAEHLSLSFHSKRHQQTSLRGLFIQSLSNPLGLIKQQRRELHILKDINFKASTGDRIAIIGKNGAGKTSLCRILSGFYQASSGKIKINGAVRSILNPNAIIYPELSGYENGKIIMEITYPHLSASERKKLFEEAIEFSGLGDFLYSPFRTYSNGMQTRLCLSLATCTPSDIFILDEVFEGADKEFKSRISNRIMNLIQKSGIVFFVSHSESHLMRVCNRAMYLKNGVIDKIDDLDKKINEYTKDTAKVLREQFAPLG